MTLDEETKSLLKTVVDHFDKEDRIVREQQLRRYRRLKLYWNSFSQIYWSESARDYRVYASDELANGSDDQSYYDRPINVFRAFLETVIAALSIQIPAVACVPDNADNPDDISTAKAGDIIAELLYKHNDVMFSWLQAMYVYYTEGMVACYIYDKEDKSYGTYKEKQYKDEKVQAFVCPHCQAQLKDELITGQGDLLSSLQQSQADPNQTIELKNNEAEEFSNEIMNEFGPDDDDIALHDAINQGPVCPECGKELDPELQKTSLVIPRFVGVNDKPKSRICLEIMGGLYVKVANYAKKQEDTPYLIWSYETHYANALEKYKDLWDDMPHGGWQNVGTNDPYEQYARINPQYRNAFPEEQVTVKNAWLRPSAFNILSEENADKMKKKFPDGAKVAMVNALVAEGCNEALDDVWTLTRDPLHDFINHDPAGELLVNVQDITSDLISLCLQTIEHGITQTWADPSVVNFDAQSQMEATPGVITPTKTQGGMRNVGEAFFTSQPAHLNPEVFQFYQIINQLGQFVSAAMPSIFGGSQESGSSRTASEYAMSRTASLQRLQTPWRMFTIWWKTIFGKAIPAYMKIIKEDEKFVKKDDAGNFTNVWIRKAELKGTIGSVELDASEQIPVSDEQKADTVMKLFELNNTEILEALSSPENLPMIRKVVRLPEFVLPGEDDRNKQYEEIKELLATQPIQLPPDPQTIQMALQTGQPPQPNLVSSIEPDPLVDNSTIEAQVCRGWLVSEAGRLAKIENPAGYQNVLLHMKAHLAIVAQQQMQMMQQQAMMGAQGNAQPGQSQKPNGQQPKAPKQNSEIKEGNNASSRPPIQ